MILLAVLAFLAADVWSVWLAAEPLGSLPMALWLCAVTSFIGLSRVARASQHAQPDAVARALAKGGDLGLTLATAFAPVIAGAFLLSPGFLSDLIAILYLLPFTRPFMARASRGIVQLLIQRGLKKMGGGLGQGFPGFPGAAGFPGGQAGTPDLAAMMAELERRARATRAPAPPRPGQGTVIDADYRVVE